MSRLAGYANHAKHRTPVVTAVAVPLVIREDTAPMDPRLLPRRPFERLEAGEVLYSAPAGEVVPLSIVPSVGIRHPRSGAWFVLAREIAAIADWVRKAAVPHLIAGRSQASNPLPAWFNTAVSVKDLRAAAASGEFVPAHEHAQLRLQARVARHQLPGLLARMPGGPSFGAAEAWLASLADAEVTRRLGGFILGPLGEPDAVAKIWKVLEKMRDDALCFSRTGTD